MTQKARTRSSHRLTEVYEPPKSFSLSIVIHITLVCFYQMSLECCIWIFFCLFSNWDSIFSFLALSSPERRRNCALTPLATSQQHNQGPVSPARLRRLRLLLDANLDRHSSEEELERISCGDNRKWVSAFPQRHGDHHSSASSDEEVRDLCGCRSPTASARPLVEPGAACLAASPSPVLFSSSPPRNLKPPPMRFQLQMAQPLARPVILTHFDQSAPYRKYRHSYSGEPGRPSLDLEKMQQVGFPVFLQKLSNTPGLHFSQEKPSQMTHKMEKTLNLS